MKNKDCLLLDRRSTRVGPDERFEREAAAVIPSSCTFNHARDHAFTLAIVRQRLRTRVMPSAMGSITASTLGFCAIQALK